MGTLHYWPGQRKGTTKQTGGGFGDRLPESR